MIAIIDYGMGNLRSVQKAFEKVGHQAIVTNRVRQILDAEAVVLPGVGAFPDCMRNLQEYGLVDAVYKTIESGRPFLGICLGLQLLFTESEEFGLHKGLDIMKGKVVRFPVNPPPPLLPPQVGEEKGGGAVLKVPHMGWNTLKIERRPPILGDTEDSSFVYFVHSYYVVPAEEDVIATTTDYGIRFTSMIWRDNIYATQFHPEKSQEVGLRILKRFGDLIK